MKPTLRIVRGGRYADRRAKPARKRCPRPAFRLFRRPMGVPNAVRAGASYLHALTAPNADRAHKATK